jgi:hypothetical protein
MISSSLPPAGRDEKINRPRHPWLVRKAGVSGRPTGPCLTQRFLVEQAAALLEPPSSETTPPLRDNTLPLPGEAGLSAMLFGGVGFHM